MDRCENGNKGVGVYRNRVTKLWSELLDNVGGLCTTARGAFLNPWVTIPLLIMIAFRDGLFHCGVYKPSLAIFLDAANFQPYNKKKVQLIAISLPQVRRPHEQSLIHRMGRWLGPDNPNDWHRIMDDWDLISVLEHAKFSGFFGHPMRIVFSPDWKCLCTVLNWWGPSHPHACPECWGLRDDWKRPGHHEPCKRLLKHFRTPLAKFLALFESPLDIVYDVLHCVALVLCHWVLHGLVLWSRERPALNLEGRLVTLYRSRLNGSYKPPLARRIGASGDGDGGGGQTKENKRKDSKKKDRCKKGQYEKEWRITGKKAKKLLKDDVFWDELGELLPRSKDGLSVHFPHITAPHELLDPMHTYVREVRRLCRQLLSWTPERVETRDADCDHLHRLYDALQMPMERTSVNIH